MEEVRVRSEDVEALHHGRCGIWKYVRIDHGWSALHVVAHHVVDVGDVARYEAPHVHALQNHVVQGEHAPCSVPIVGDHVDCGYRG